MPTAKPRHHRPAQLSIFALRPPEGPGIRLTSQDVERIRAAAGARGVTIDALIHVLVDAEFERARKRIRDLDALEARQ